MKTCTKCKIDKSEIEFPKKRSGHASYCLACQREYGKAHYKNNKRMYLDRNQQRRKRMAAYVKAIKEGSPCKDCRISYPYFVMDFDHLGGKEDDISKAQARGGWAALKSEISKCDLVCSNCHRARTHFRLGQNCAEASLR